MVQQLIHYILQKDFFSFLRFSKKAFIYACFIRALMLSGASQVVLVIKNLPANARDIRDVGSIPGLGRSPGGGHDNTRPLFLPGDPHGQRSLVGYSPQGHKESGTTEATEHNVINDT